MVMTILIPSDVFICRPTNIYSLGLGLLCSRPTTICLLGRPSILGLLGSILGRICDILGLLCSILGRICGILGRICSILDRICGIFDLLVKF